MNNATAQLPEMSETEKPVAIAWDKFIWLVVVALLLICILLWQFISLRAENNQTKQKIIYLEFLAHQQKEQEQKLQQQLSLVTAKVETASGQVTVLENLYNKLGENSDQRKLIEIEQSVNLAAQQLILAGQNSTAIKLLSRAYDQAKLLNHARFLPLQRALQEDLKQLQNLPEDDVISKNRLLQELVENISSLPLAMAVDTVAQADRKFTLKNIKNKIKNDNKEIVTVKANWWEQKLANLQTNWQNFTFSGREYFKIREINANLPMIITPDQAFFLRENVKLHLISARVSLLTNNWKNAKNELEFAEDWLNNYFERNNEVNIAQRTVANLIKEIDNKTSNKTINANLNKSINAINQLNRYLTN